MATIYVRAVPGELDAWLDALAAELGVSKAALVRMILSEARAQGRDTRVYPDTSSTQKGKRNADHQA